MDDHKGKGVDLEEFNKILRMYYEMRKCDPDTGLPKTDELERLGLHDVARKLRALEGAEAGEAEVHGEGAPAG